MTETERRADAARHAAHGAARYGAYAPPIDRLERLLEMEE